MTSGRFHPSPFLSLLSCFLLRLAVLFAVVSAARADDGQLVQRFDGHDSLTTSDFTVPDGWEVRWRSDQVLSVGVIRLDNTVVAGATGRGTGSLYVPQGRQYRLRVKGENPIPWDVAVYALPPPDAAGTEAPSSYYIPTAGPAFTPAKPAVQPAPPTTNSTAASTNAAAAVTDTNGASATAPTLPTQLTADQARAVVEVKGTRAEGAGFLLKTATGPVVVTSLRLISNNPDLEILTKSGSEVKILNLQAAPDRDLVMIGIQDQGYAYLELDTSATVQTGDALLTATTTNASVPVQGVTEHQLEFRHLRAPPGGPLVLASTGRALAMVDSLPRTPITARINSDSFPDREAGVVRSATTVGLRLDTVPQWIACPWNQFNTETKFLDDFHQHSRCLDSYLNGDSDHNGSNTKIFLTDEKIKSANDTFVQEAAESDRAGRNDAMRTLLFELGLVADTDVDQISRPENFALFDRQRAKDELTYRQALKAQIEGYTSDVTRFDAVVHRDN